MFQFVINAVKYVHKYQYNTALATAILVLTYPLIMTGIDHSMLAGVFSLVFAVSIGYLGRLHTKFEAFKSLNNSPRNWS